jgi:hypothetical protein
MKKRFASIIIIANIIMGSLLYLSSQIILFDFDGATVKGFNVFSIYGTPAQVGSVIVPIEWVMPNFPFYVFLLFLIVNAFFIVGLKLGKE